MFLQQIRQFIQDNNVKCEDLFAMLAAAVDNEPTVAGVWGAEEPNSIHFGQHGEMLDHSKIQVAK